MQFLAVQVAINDLLNRRGAHVVVCNTLPASDRATGKSTLVALAASRLAHTRPTLWISLAGLRHETTPALPLHRALLLSLATRLRSLFVDELQIQQQQHVHLPLQTCDALELQTYLTTLVSFLAALPSAPPLPLLVLDGAAHPSELALLAHLGLPCVVTTRTPTLASLLPPGTTTTVTVSGLSGMKECNALLHLLTGTADVSGPSLRAVASCGGCIVSAVLLGGLVRGAPLDLPAAASTPGKTRNSSGSGGSGGGGGSTARVTLAQALPLALERMPSDQRRALLLLGLLPAGVGLPWELVARLWGLSLRGARRMGASLAARGVLVLSPLSAPSAHSLTSPPSPDATGDAASPGSAAEASSLSCLRLHHEVAAALRRLLYTDASLGPLATEGLRAVSQHLCDAALLLHAGPQGAEWAHHLPLVLLWDWVRRVAPPPSCRDGFNAILAPLADPGTVLVAACKTLAQEEGADASLLAGAWERAAGILAALAPLPRTSSATEQEPTPPPSSSAATCLEASTRLRLSQLSRSRAEGDAAALLGTCSVAVEVLGPAALGSLVSRAAEAVRLPASGSSSSSGSSTGLLSPAGATELSALRAWSLEQQGHCAAAQVGFQQSRAWTLAGLQRDPWAASESAGPALLHTLHPDACLLLACALRTLALTLPPTPTLVPPPEGGLAPSIETYRALAQPSLDAIEDSLGRDASPSSPSSPSSSSSSTTNSSSVNSSSNSSSSTSALASALQAQRTELLLLACAHLSPVLGGLQLARRSGERALAGLLRERGDCLPVVARGQMCLLSALVRGQSVDKAMAIAYRCVYIIFCSFVSRLLSSLSLYILLFHSLIFSFSYSLAPLTLTQHYLISTTTPSPLPSRPKARALLRTAVRPRPPRLRPLPSGMFDD